MSHTKGFYQFQLNANCQFGTNQIDQTLRYSFNTNFNLLSIKYLSDSANSKTIFITLHISHSTSIFCLLYYFTYNILPLKIQYQLLGQERDERCSHCNTNSSTPRQFHLFPTSHPYESTLTS